MKTTRMSIRGCSSTRVEGRSGMGSYHTHVSKLRNFCTSHWSKHLVQWHRSACVKSLGDWQHSSTPSQLRLLQKHARLTYQVRGRASSPVLILLLPSLGPSINAMARTPVHTRLHMHTSWCSLLDQMSNYCILIGVLVPSEQIQ